MRSGVAATVLLQLLLQVLVPAARGQHVELGVSLHPGVHFRRMSKVLATSAHPVNFTKDLDPPEWKTEASALLAKLRVR